MRSALYVPGDAPAKLAKALASGADSLIIDLEDAVPPAAKQDARYAVAAFLATVTDPAPRLWVRVNPGPAGLADAEAVAGPWLSGICLAKTETADELRALNEVLTRAEELVGLTPGHVKVSPLIESAAALLRALDLAGAPRVHRMQLGEADLAADLGVTPGPDELLYARSHVVAVSAAAGLAPPLGPVSTDFRDLDRLRESSESLRRLGFQGRACIHPAQLPAVHEVFTPSAEQVAAAQDVLDRLAAAGGGVAVDAHGRFIDEAVARSARRLLALAPPTPLAP
ncbi:HpcH/HpaI aldolase/citrate lyase family protein [Hamadaea tsunoensis]|uniref:HpcH/HpaI aldolase/citrate lyase family protein n=1 Tax=Hamadaea tsunoensis TaxID=53368 RepID=UPI0004194985|nr:CoA ester lyase [Hamadaea tsunoensis]